MADTLVIYQSKYGFTEKYAQWIAEELNADIVPLEKISGISLQAYKTIVYGGGIYAGGISGFKKFSKIFPAISDKKIAVFTCGLIDPSNANNVQHIRTEIYKTLTPQLKENLRFFHLRGGLDYEKLRFPHRIIIDMLRKASMKKDPGSITGIDESILDAGTGLVDYTDRAAISQIISFCKPEA